MLDPSQTRPTTYQGTALKSNNHQRIYHGLLPSCSSDSSANLFPGKAMF